MTQNTREVEEFSKLAHGVKARIEQQQTPNEEGANKALQILIDTHHHQLQKARHDWLREEIVRLEGMKEEPRGPWESQGSDSWNQALQTIIDRYQAELDQDNK